MYKFVNIAIIEINEYRNKGDFVSIYMTASIVHAITDEYAI